MSAYLRKTDMKNYGYTKCSFGCSHKEWGLAPRKYNHERQTQIEKGLREGASQRERVGRAEEMKAEGSARKTQTRLAESTRMKKVKKVKKDKVNTARVDRSRLTPPCSIAGPGGCHPDVNA